MAENLESAWNAVYLKNMIDKMTDEYQIDSRRIYGLYPLFTSGILFKPWVGHSMGASGIIAITWLHANLFAACAIKNHFLSGTLQVSPG